MAAAQVSFEVERVIRDDARLIEYLYDLTAQVLDFGRGLAFAVDGSHYDNRRSSGLDEARLDRSPQRVVDRAEFVITAVPGADRLAADIVEHPALARVHAG